MKFLNFLHSIDLFQNNRLSITNLMMFVLIIRIALVPVIDWQALVGLFLALSSYLHKRHTRDKSATQIEAVKASAVANAKEVKIQLDQLNDKVKQLETSNNLSKLSR